MRARTFWRGSLALPILCPLIAIGVMWGAAKLGEPPLIVTQALVTVGMSGYLFGIPYALFAALLLAILWSRSLSAYRRAALVAPLLFDLVFMAIVAIYDLASHVELAQVFSPGMLSFYLLELVVGYSYVGLVFAGDRLFTRLNLIEQAGGVSERSA
jgi:hypothetical protein